MEHARVYIGDELYMANGKPLTVNAASYVRLVDEKPDICFSLKCKECGNPAFLNDTKGAKGIKLVNLEVTRRKKANRRSSPGFSHYSGNKNAVGKTIDCSLYFANDPRFQGIRDGNEFDALEKTRNAEAWAKPYMREAIDAVQNFFMHRLTGSPEISTEDRIALNQAEKKLGAMTGIAENMWAVGYLSILLIGSRHKKMHGREYRLEYKGVGVQNLPVEGMDGQKRVMRVPQYIALCFSRRDGKEPMPLWENRTSQKPVQFDVSREFSRSLVQTEINKRRADEAALQKGMLRVARRPGRHRPLVPGQPSLDLGGSRS